MNDVYIITGGAGAMGLCAAKRFGQDGVKILLVDLSQEALDKGIKELAAAQIQAVGFQMDVTDKDKAVELAEFAAKEGKIMGLLNLAGISPKGGPDYNVPGSLVFDIAVKGTVYLSQEIVKVMAEGACIININSTSPYLVSPGSMEEVLYPRAIEDFEEFLGEMHVAIDASGDAQTARNNAYVWGRNFIAWFTEYFATQIGRENKRVVSVSPGVVDGPMVEESGLGLARMSALGRTGTPSEMAEIYAFLLSNKASYITGTNILADGGIVAAIHNMKR